MSKNKSAFSNRLFCTEILAEVFHIVYKLVLCGVLRSELELLRHENGLFVYELIKLVARSIILDKERRLIGQKLVEANV